MMRKFGSWYMRNFGVRSGKAHDMATTIIFVVIGIFILAAIVPTAITNLSTANTSGWSTSVISMWNLLPIVIVAGLILVVFAFVRRKSPNM